jgi:hypothetical protein
VEPTEQGESRKTTVTIEVEPDLLQWLREKSAERLVQGFEHGKRSMGAVIRDLIVEAREKDAVAA